MIVQLMFLSIGMAWITLIVTRHEEGGIYHERYDSTDSITIYCAERSTGIQGALQGGISIMTDRIVQFCDIYQALQGGIPFGRISIQSSCVIPKTQCSVVLILFLHDCHLSDDLLMLTVICLVSYNYMC